MISGYTLGREHQGSVTSSDNTNQYLTHLRTFTGIFIFLVLLTCRCLKNSSIESFETFLIYRCKNVLYMP